MVIIFDYLDIEEVIITTMVKLDADRFLNELGKLFERNKDKGSVFLTMKRSTCNALLVM